MARPQIQLPGVAQPVPQARPTDQFVQTKPHYPVPKHILDLARFSPTLTNLVTQAQMDAHERSFAQGQIDATYAAPFGSSAVDTPEADANRKAFKAEQESGKILASEDPWYRIGLYTGEGRRAALTMHTALLSDENIRAQSRVYDDKGEFIPFEQREDPEAIFARQSAVFLRTPALQNVYGQKAAAGMVEASRAEFVAKVAHRRDQETQAYHETQLSDQTVEQLSRIALAAPDQSPEGRARTEEATAGLHDLIAEWTVKWNLPDGPKVARQGFLAFIDKAAVSSPQAAVEAIDLIRKVKIGPAVVGADNSQDGVAFRAKLQELDTHYRYAASVEGERMERNAKRYKEAYLSRVEDVISEGFASGITPAAAYGALKARIKNEVEPRFQDEALAELDKHYSDALKPLPTNPGAEEEMDRRLLVDTTDEIAEWIDGIAGSEVSYGQAREMRKRLQAESESWKNLPEVKLSADAFKADAEVFAADRSEAIQDTLRGLTNEQVASANQRIQLRAKGLTGEQRIEQMGGIVKDEYAKATQVLADFKRDIQSRSVAFDRELLAANGKGLRFEAEIVKARENGLLNRSEFNAAVQRNNEAADISTYTNDDRVRNIVRDMFPTAQDYNQALFGRKWGQINDAQLRAIRMAQEWAVNERPKYESQGAADNAFATFVNEKIRREVGKAMEVEGADKPASGIGTPGGPTMTQADQAEDGKAFQVALEYGNADMLRTAAVKAYTIPFQNPPKSVIEFQANFGTRNGKITQIRERARQELAAGLGYGADQIGKRALLRAGAATPKELLDGVMDVNGMKIPIAPSDVDIWKTMVFVSTRQFEQACAVGYETVYDIAERYGVQEADFDSWVKQQGLLLKVNGL